MGAKVTLASIKTDPIHGMKGDINKAETITPELTLDEVDTDGVAPMTSVVATTHAERDDVVDDGGITEDILANAPERDNGFFVVPRVVE